MKNRDVYDLSLALLADGGDRLENGDYEERAGYLLAAFASDTEIVDRRLRASRGDESADYETEIPIFLALEEDFPLDRSFVTAAGHYLASMLILEEDPELSEVLFDRYCTLLREICDDIPMKSCPIADRYGM